ncbi:MAG TPA: hypothetical protein VK623_04960, partial [Flavobacterium sp.]|nr:hypothetical protein [Flavobacterium sp.]
MGFIDEMQHLKGVFLHSPKNLIYLANNFDKKIFYLLLHPMKIVPTRILILLALIFPLADCIAAPVNNPPPPLAPGPPPPPPPGLPVDSGIVLLLVVSIL